MMVTVPGWMELGPQLSLGPRSDSDSDSDSDTDPSRTGPSPAAVTPPTEPWLEWPAGPGLPGQHILNLDVPIMVAGPGPPPQGLAPGLPCKQPHWHDSDRLGPRLVSANGPGLGRFPGGRCGPGAASPAEIRAGLLRVIQMSVNELMATG
jgi:hypothetical protein